jgi:hypothetical protein
MGGGWWMVDAERGKVSETLDPCSRLRRLVAREYSNIIFLSDFKAEW